jgi:hypothetical protein
MLPIQDTCQPRSDILQGSFNSEIFTASLSQVMDRYRGKPVATHALYTDAESFFREATYTQPRACAWCWQMSSVASRVRTALRRCTGWRRRLVGEDACVDRPDPPGLPRP